jgi:hypothetical protein
MSIFLKIIGLHSMDNKDRTTNSQTTLARAVFFDDIAAS